MTTPALDTSARDMLEAWLADRGLQGLGDFAWNLYLQGKTPQEIYVAVKDTPQYQQRYPAMAELERTGRAISEDAYRSYESTVANLLQRYGVPNSMYSTPQGIKDLLLANVSASEVNDRLTLASTAAFQAPASVKQAAETMYGMGHGDLTAYFLDPDKALPLLQQRWNAAQVAGAASEQSQQIDQATAERLAAQGVGYAQAQQGFGNVNQLQELTLNQEGKKIGQGDLVDSQFGSSTAAKTVQSELKRRQAEYQQGGSLAAGQQGVSGLKSADQ